MGHGLPYDTVLLSNTVKMFTASQKEFASGYGWGCTENFLEFIDGEDFKCRSRLEDITLAIFSLNINSSITKSW